VRLWCKLPNGHTPLCYDCESTTHHTPTTNTERGAE